MGILGRVLGFRLGLKRSLGFFFVLRFSGLGFRGLGFRVFRVFRVLGFFFKDFRVFRVSGL